jgi:hypothetical protein
MSRREGPVATLTSALPSFTECKSDAGVRFTILRRRQAVIDSKIVPRPHGDIACGLFRRTARQHLDPGENEPGIDSKSCPSRTLWVKKPEPSRSPRSDASSDARCWFDLRSDVFTRWLTEGLNTTRIPGLPWFPGTTRSKITRGDLVLAPTAVDTYFDRGKFFPWKVSPQRTAFHSAFAEQNLWFLATARRLRCFRMTAGPRITAEIEPHRAPRGGLWQ